MDIPRELRWIGPLFVGLFVVLWLKRGLHIFLIITMYSLAIPIFAPVLLILILMAIEIGGRLPRYMVITLVTYLSIFSSGILIEPIPIPYTGPYPPPPIIPAPTVLFTPLIAIFSLAFAYPPTSTIISALLLVVLLCATFIVTKLVSDGKFNAAQAVLFYVIIIICWTISPIPISFDRSSSSFLTPIPLGPLVALNILPWIPVRKTEPQESHNQ